MTDVKTVTDKAVLAKLSDTIVLLKSSESLTGTPNLKKLKGHPSAYRIKLGHYRLGFFLEGNTLILVKFQNRKDIYKKFPQ